MNDQDLLREAISEARTGLREGGLPIGSVLADTQGRIVARGHNLRVQSGDPTAQRRKTARLGGVDAGQHVESVHHVYRYSAAVQNSSGGDRRESEFSWN